MRSKTKVEYHACAILKQSLGQMWRKWLRVVPTVLRKTPAKRSPGKRERVLTSNGFEMSRRAHCWCRWPTSCTTPGQYLRIIEKLVRKCGSGSSEGASNSCGILTSC